jgi:hypothetical protein
MPSFLTIEGFGYGSNDALQAVWQTGLRDANVCLIGETGSPAGVATLDTGAMTLQYDNTGTTNFPYSEVKAQSSSPVDWTVGGLIEAVSVSVGVDGNIFSGMNPEYDHVYFALEDTAGNIGIVYHDDYYAQKRQFTGPGSHIWNIDFADFGSVDMTDKRCLCWRRSQMLMGHNVRQRQFNRLDLR